MRKRLAVAGMLGAAVCAGVLLLPREPMPMGASQYAEAAPAPVRQASQAVAVAPAARAGARRVYPYSIVPGGVSGRAEVVQLLQTDRVVAQHYAGLQVARLDAVTVARPRAVYVSYRKGDHVYWTSRKVMLAEGETLLSDGSSEIRGRCGNRISDLPRLPVEADGPSAQVLDTAMAMDAGDAGADGKAKAGDAVVESASGAGADSAPAASQPQYRAGSAYGGLAPADARPPAALALLKLTGTTGGGAPFTRPDNPGAPPPMVAAPQTGGVIGTGVPPGTPGTTSGTTSGATPVVGADPDDPNADEAAALAPLLAALAQTDTPPVIIAKAPVKSAELPEPDSLCLSGIALAAMLALRRKTRRPRQG